MKKFVGLVNGKSFDNEKDFQKAALKAMESNDEVLSISSYYTNECFAPVEKVEEPEKIGYNLKRSDYLVTDSQKKRTEVGEIYYDVPENISETINNAMNKNEVVSDIRNSISRINILINDNKYQIRKIRKQLNELKESEETLIAQRKYYKQILKDVNNTPNQNKETDDDTDAVIDSCVDDVLSFLKKLGLY